MTLLSKAPWPLCDPCTTDDIGYSKIREINKGRKGNCGKGFANGISRDAKNWYSEIRKINKGRAGDCGSALVPWITKNSKGNNVKLNEVYIEQLKKRERPIPFKLQNLFTPQPQKGKKIFINQMKRNAKLNDNDPVSIYNGSINVNLTGNKRGRRMKFKYLDANNVAIKKKYNIENLDDIMRASNKVNNDPRLSPEQKNALLMELNLLQQKLTVEPEDDYSSDSSSDSSSDDSSTFSDISSIRAPPSSRSSRSTRYRAYNDSQLLKSDIDRATKALEDELAYDESQRLIRELNKNDSVLDEAIRNSEYQNLTLPQLRDIVWNIGLPVRDDSTKNDIIRVLENESIAPGYKYKQKTLADFLFLKDYLNNANINRDVIDMDMTNVRNDEDELQKAIDANRVGLRRNHANENTKRRRALYVRKRLINPKRRR